MLIKKGYKIIVVTEQHDKKLKPEEKFEGIEIHRMPGLKEGRLKKFKIWKWLWKNRNLIKSADIVHCHDVFFWYLPFRFLLPKKPVFTTFHGYEGNSLPTKKAVLMHKVAEKLSLGNICVGDYLKKWYGTKPNYVTYGAVEGRKSKDLRKTEFIEIAYVGRLEEEAGIMVYLKALKRLVNKGFKIKLVVLGDGIQRQQAEKFCKVNRLTVDFKGFVTNVPDYLANTNYVFTSRFLSTLEALNAKRFTFVVYNNAVKKDCFGMSPFGKFISLSKDEVSLVSDFIYYMKHRDLMENRLANGYNWVKEQTWKRLEDLYLKLWKNNG